MFPFLWVYVSSPTKCDYLRLTWEHGLPWWLSGKEYTCQYRRRVHFLGWEDPLEKGMATHPRILAWRIPQTEVPGGLQSTGLQKSWIQLSWLNINYNNKWEHECQEPNQQVVPLTTYLPPSCLTVVLTMCILFHSKLELRIKLIVCRLNNVKLRIKIWISINSEERNDYKITSHLKSNIKPIF